MKTKFRISFTLLFVVLLLFGCVAFTGSSSWFAWAEGDDPVPVTSITLDKTSADLKVGETTTLAAKVDPDNATDKTVAWTSSDDTVATVVDGTVTGVKAGTATITAANAASGESATCAVTVTAATVPVTSISLNNTTAALKVGETTTLAVTILPAEATDKTVAWTSSKEAVATVDQNGKITANAVGEATITAANTASGKSATCTVTVTAATVPVTSITLDNTTAALKVGETTTLAVTILPAEATDKTVAWTSSKEAVATVDQNGKITANAVGEATITAANTASGKSATCTVTVTAATVPVTSIALLYNELTLSEGQTQTLEPTVTPSNATNASVNWSSSDPSVVSISNKGSLKAEKVGTAVITASAADGSGVTATCKVTVISGTVAVTGVSLDASTADLTIGATKTLTAAIAPSDASNKTVTWQSTKDSVAKVAASATNPLQATITAVAAGEATIIVTTADGGKTAMCTVTVASDNVAVTGVTINSTVSSMNVGESLTLAATVAPTDATNQNVAWSSSDDTIATVDNKGAVTAIAAGTVTITATTEDGAFTASTTLTINTVAVSAVSVTPSEASIIVGGTTQLTAAVTPDNATDKTVTWSSSSESTATVDANGLVTGVALGTATITATSGDYIDTCVISVVNDQVTGLAALEYDQKIRINWDAIDGAAGYHIYVTYTASGELYKTYDTTKTYCNFTNLTNGTDYTFMVCAYYIQTTEYKTTIEGEEYTYSKDETVYGVYSDELTATPYDNAIKNLTATAGNKMIKLAWDAVDGAEGYYIYAMYGDGSKYKTYSTTKTTCNFTSLTNGKEYQFKVRSYNTDTSGTKGYSNYSYVVSAVPQVDSNLAAVTGLEALNFNQKIRVDWNKVSGAKGYHIYVTYTTTGEPYKTYDTTKTYCNFTKLTNGTQYSFKVCAYTTNSSGTKNYGAYSSVVTATPVNDTVTNLKAEPANSKIALSWDAVDGATGYYIYAMYADGSKYKTYSTTKTTCNFNKLTNGDGYSFKIKIYKTDASGTKVYSTYCSPVSATPEPAGVSNLQALTFNNKVRVNWDSISGATGYKIHVVYAADGTLYKDYETKKTYCNFTDLTNGTAYSFQVCAYYNNSAGTKSYGKYCDAVTATPEDDTVANLRATASSRNTTVSLSWNEVDGATGYEVYVTNADGSKYGTYLSDNNSYSLTDLTGGSTYQVKVRAYKDDSTGSRFYGSYSEVVETTPGTQSRF